jgi:RPA family protein
MKTSLEIINKLSDKEAVKLGMNVELGLVQDITKDLDTVAASLTSIRPALIKIEDLLIKNSKVVELANKAIQRVETVAKELGADALVKELDKPKLLSSEFNKTINNTLKSIQNSIANL